MGNVDSTKKYGLSWIILIRSHISSYRSNKENLVHLVVLTELYLVNNKYVTCHILKHIASVQNILLNVFLLKRNIAGV